MIYRPIEIEESEQVRQFLQRLGWGVRVADPARFRTLIQNSDRTMSAWEEGELLGFARALCDEVSNGYISLVAVDPRCHGRGIGRELIQRLMGDDPRITWVLRAGRDSHEFWAKLGFRVSAIAMERLRSQ